MSFAAETKPIIFGCDGTALESSERDFFEDSKPAGFILFAKNCESDAQVQKLCDELRETVAWEAPILIDQEGGRVQRLKWHNFPPMRGFGRVYMQNENAALAAVENNYTALANAQTSIGVDVNCVPVLDVVADDAHTKAIGDRAFSADFRVVAALGLAAARAAIAAHMTPVMKHMPGHGRATVDSHHDLPRVSDPRTVLETDWYPFRMLTENIDNDTIWGMTAHVIYSALDPDFPATLSKSVISEIIRGEIGFDGLLLTDDLFMDALKPYGDVPTVTRMAIEAGNDIALHCHGTVGQREKAAKAVGDMRPITRQRLAAWAQYGLKGPA